MKAHFHTTLRVAILSLLFINLLAACEDGAVPVATATSTPTQLPTPTAVPPFPKTLDLQHDLMIERGYAVTTPTDCPQSLNGMEAGVILGMSPVTCEVAEYQPVEASFDVSIPPEYVNSVITIKIAWPNDSIRGLRSTTFAAPATIYVDDEMIWKKETLTSQGSRFYYAARSEPILLTFVPREARNYKVRISMRYVDMIWDIGSIQLLASPYPKNVMGIAYSPYSPCQEPSTDIYPLVESVPYDIRMLAQSATAIRTYSSTGINGHIPGMAEIIGIPVYAGVWLDNPPAAPNHSADDLEMQGIFEIAKNDPIQAAIVGNEYHLRHVNEPGDLDYLVSRIKEFRAAYPEIPVATAEIDSLAFNWSGDGSVTINPSYKPVLDQVDIFFVHIYPFWSYLPVEGAAAYTVDRYLAMKSVLDVEYGGTKRLMIGEAGWPEQGGPGQEGSAGNASGSQVEAQDTKTAQMTSVFHPEAQRKYMIELLSLAQKYQVDLFYFDAFDELWKTEGENGAGRSWGLSYGDRSAKYSFSSLLIPAENLPLIDQGDIFRPYSESDFNWGIGSYPIYTEWPHEPKGRLQDLPDFQPYSLALMGNRGKLSIDQCHSNSHSGVTALEVSYLPNRELSGAHPSTLNWAGAFWLYPQNNWASYAEGQNVSDAQSLTFWARGRQGGEVVEFVSGGICEEFDGTKLPLCPDSIQPRVSTGPVVLTDQWQKYTLDLRTADRSNIIGAFGFSISNLYNPNETTFYLDDIAFSPEIPAAADHVYPHIGSTFNIYTDDVALENHYIPSNYMGDAVGFNNFYLSPAWNSNQDSVSQVALNSGLYLTQDLNSEPHSGTTAIKVEYVRGQNGWAGVYWTDPDKNWGQRPGGYDLTGVTSLTFWARSDAPEQGLKILIGGLGCSQSYFPYRDSVCGAVPVPLLKLTTEWKQYTVDLTTVQRDWSQLLGGFGFVVTQTGTFYLDDIIYHFDP